MNISNVIYIEPLMKIIGITILLVIFPVSLSYGEEDHDEHEEEEDGGLVMDAGERKAVGIITEQLKRSPLSEVITVPAEIMLNAYNTSNVTPRITAQVVERHARLGDRVETDKALVTLSSVAMAEAQGTLIVATREWQRVKKLGKGAVSEKRYTEAQVAQQQAVSRVLAYGMDHEQVSSLMNSGDASMATGEFDLLAPQDGTILQDDFIVGELIEPGRVLFTVSDESTLWVEAKTFSSQLHNVNIGDPADVTIDQKTWITGKIVQVHHRLDETTRTQGLRIEITNDDDEFHPGQFVEAGIITGYSDPVVSVPGEAIVLLDGASSVFTLEEGNEFHQQMIELGETVGERTVVTSGLAAGDTIAIKGVFHLKSMVLKSTLGEGHGH
jgi:membrane fusion protein, heavy metal efflux system